MQLFFNNKKIDILDYFLLQDSVRIKILAIFNIEKINSQYFIRQKSFRKIYYYLKEIGIKNTFIKIMSRTREKLRNEKYFSLGIGRVLESTSHHYQIGQTVYFIAYNHPACPERVIIHEKAVFLSKESELPWIKNNKIAWFKNRFFDMTELSDYIAWSPYSGRDIPDLSQSVQEEIQLFWKNINIQDAVNIKFNKTQIITCTEEHSKNFAKKSAVLFGYGNYAKTILIPNLHNGIDLTAIHEIDPTQLHPLKSQHYYNTDPFIKDNEQYDVYFIAGFHHTHADLAIAGLERMSDVVVEKPVVTTQNELEKLLLAMQNTSAELYSCFQRRYHVFNDYLFQDFKIKKDDPISYYAIVHEESLPQYHWYQWPNSRSAIISNGCHWIDHFLFLNNYSLVTKKIALKTQKNEIMILVELENGATLSLTLSHLGSARIGMQDYIELRSGQSTAKITNSRCYVSENISRIIRKKQVNKYDAFKNMYKTISENIVNKSAPRLSDSPKKLKMVSSLILSLDEMVSYSI